MASEIIRAIVLDDETGLTFIEVCQHCSVSERVLSDLIAHGLLPHSSDEQTLRFDGAMLARIQSASRLRNDLGLNIPGVVLALELLDELEQLRQEVTILQRHIQE